MSGCDSGTLSHLQFPQMSASHCNYRSRTQIVSLHPLPAAYSKLCCHYSPTLVLGLACKHRNWCFCSKEHKKRIAVKQQAAMLVCKLLCHNEISVFCTRGWASSGFAIFCTKQYTRCPHLAPSTVKPKGTNRWCPVAPDTTYSPNGEEGRNLRQLRLLPRY